MRNRENENENAKAKDRKQSQKVLFISSNDDNNNEIIFYLFECEMRIRRSLCVCLWMCVRFVCCSCGKKLFNVRTECECCFQWVLVFVKVCVYACYVFALQYARGHFRQTFDDSIRNRRRICEETLLTLFGFCINIPDRITNRCRWPHIRHHQIDVKVERFITI